MILYIVIYWFFIFLFEAKENHFLQKISIWKYGFLNFFGALGGPPVKNFSKKGSKSSTITRIKKWLTFETQKITLKLIYGCFPIGGAGKAPPCQIGLKMIYLAPRKTSWCEEKEFSYFSEIMLLKSFPVPWKWKIWNILRIDKTKLFWSYFWQNERVNLTKIQWWEQVSFFIEVSLV